MALNTQSSSDPRLILWRRLYRLICWLGMAAIITLMLYTIVEQFSTQSLMIFILDSSVIGIMLLSRYFSMNIQVYSVITVIFIVSIVAGINLSFGYINFIILSPVIYIIGIIHNNNRLIVVSALICALLIPIMNVVYNWRFSPEKIISDVSVTISWSIIILFIAPLFIGLNNALQKIWKENEQRRIEAETLQQNQYKTLTTLEQKNQEQTRLLELVQDLETPIIPVLDNVLVLPVTGYLDPARSKRLQTTLLQRIERESTHTVLIDVTGIKLLDQASLSQLLELISSVRLMGSECLLTGIRPETARELVNFGVAFKQLQTAASLRDGIALLLT